MRSPGHLVPHFRNSAALQCGTGPCINREKRENTAGVRRESTYSGDAALLGLVTLRYFEKSAGRGSQRCINDSCVWSMQAHQPCRRDA